MPRIRSIHVSDIREYKNCRLKWYYSSPLRLNLTSKHVPVALYGGSLAHVGLEALYDSNPISLERCLSAYDQWVESKSDELNRVSNSQKLFDIVELMRGILTHYHSWALKHDDFHVLASEIPFKFPLPHIGHNVYFEGTADGFVQRKDKKFWFLEHKTTSRFPDPKVLFLDDQCRGYPWAARVSGRFVKREPIGMIYTFLFKALPERPRLLKKGNRLSKDRRIKTTAEIYEQEIERQGLEITEYRDFLAYLRSQPHRFFRRHYIEIAERSLQAFGQELMNVGEEMINPTTPIYPNRNWQTCNYCQFEIPCNMRSAGFDDTPILKALYKKRERYRKLKSKRCTKCKQWKPISEFNKRGTSKDGLQSWCRECQRAYRKRRKA